MQNYRALIKNLEDFVLAESANQMAQLEKKWSRPLSDRLAKGDAIAGLNVQSAIYDGRITLTCTRNDSRFREGDYIFLHKGSPTDDDAILVTIEDDQETTLVVRLNDGDIYYLEEYPDGWIADEGFLDLTKFYLDAINQAADTTVGREIVLPLLTGNKEPNVEFQNYQRAGTYSEASGLNDSQAEAVAYGYSTDLVHLIQGPPGTGKTFVLAQLAKLFIQDGLRVYITALTHRAINNALDKIFELDNTLPVCKIGQDVRAKNLKVPNHEGFYGSGFDELEGGYIIGATPFATRTSRLGNVDFDVVIFDEASQVTLPLAIMGMLPARKYIFIGDEYQLPPVTTSKSSEIAKYSIFEYLCDRGFDTMLTTTYRLNRELATWPSRTFYKGKIQPSTKAAGRRFNVEIKDPRWHKVFNPDHSAIFINHDHRNTTVKSQDEADTVCAIVEQLLNAEFTLDEIGVVVPYRVQSRLIRNGLRKMIGDQGDWQDLIVDTVERMQGQEKEIVIVSLTTSNPAFASQIGEFYFQPQRLNVAVTRPRTKLIILGSTEILKAISTDPEVRQWITIFTDLISSCKHIHISDIQT
jgi:DNA replication ATP-dependent helicase Dna2